MGFARYIEKMRKEFENGGQPALCWIKFRSNSEMIRDAELLGVKKTFIRIGHDGDVQLIPLDVIERISIYDDE